MRQRESILASVGDGIWGLDIHGNLTFCNEAGASMFGYKVDEIIGKNTHQLVHHSKADGTPYPYEDCPIQRALHSEEPVRVDNEVFWRKDGTCFPVEYVARQLVHDGIVSGTVVAFADVSERRRLDRMKDEFISTVAMNCARRSLRSAPRSASSPAACSRSVRRSSAQMLDVAIGNCDRLVRLVNDILDFERIGSGRLPLHREKANAVDLLRRAADLQHTAAASHNITFRIDAQPRRRNGGRGSHAADPDQPHQQCGEVLTPGGEVRLTATATGENEVTFEVEDHGRGIPPEKLEIIFERFQQVDASDSRPMGGTGLGLAICRAIVEQHGGRISVHSKLGQGSVFTFTMPRSLS